MRLPKDPALLANVFLAAAWIALTAPRVSLAELLSRVDSGPLFRRLGGSRERAERAIGYIRKLSSRPPFSWGKENRTCLIRSLVSYAALKQVAPGIRIQFGIRKGEPGGIDGHCWVESAGKPLFESPETVTRYELFLTHP